MPHWIYVVLSQVRSLNSLVINEKLDESRDYTANQKVLNKTKCGKKKQKKNQRDAKDENFNNKDMREK